MAVVHQSHKTGSAVLSPQERRELVETAQVFEMIVEANPLEVGALEALREIYVKLGDADKHADVVRRIAEANGQPAADPAPASPPAPVEAAAPATPPAPPLASSPPAPVAATPPAPPPSKG